MAKLEGLGYSSGHQSIEAARSELQLQLLHVLLLVAAPSLSFLR